MLNMPYSFVVSRPVYLYLFLPLSLFFYLFSLSLSTFDAPERNVKFEVQCNHELPTLPSASITHKLYISPSDLHLLFLCFTECKVHLQQHLLYEQHESFLVLGIYWSFLVFLPTKICSDFHGNVKKKQSNFLKHKI